MNYPDEILDQQKNSFELTNIFDCSMSTILKWKKNGLEYYQGLNSNAYQNYFTKKPDTFIIRNVVEYLQEHKGKRYLKSFEHYLASKGYRMIGSEYMLLHP